MTERRRADRAVRAVASTTNARTAGAAEQAADPMRLRLAQARPEDAGVFAAVVDAALALGPADERRAPGPALRQRVIGLCDRCQAALERSRSIRAQRAELVASVLAGRVGARPGG